MDSEKSERSNELLSYEGVIAKKCAEASAKVRKEGNELFLAGGHDKKLHMKILSLYNESAALAENDSEELARAYYNRSALLMHLRKYNQCWNDIEQAYSITKSENLKDKLLERKSKYLRSMYKTKKREETAEELSDFPDEFELLKPRTFSSQLEKPTIERPSKRIPCASECVSLSYDENYGRHIVAEEDIQPGKIIAIEEGFVLFPKRDNTYLNCSHCLALAYNAVPCQNCAVAIYCSEECRRMAEISYHSVECKILPYLKFADSQSRNLTDTMVAMRILLIAIQAEGLQAVLSQAEQIDHSRKDILINGFFDDGSFKSDKFKSLYNLTYEVTTTTTDHWFAPLIDDVTELLAIKTNIFQQSNDNSEIIVDTNLSFLKSLIYKLILIVDSNAFTFQGSNCYCESNDVCRLNCGERDIGVIIAPFCSLINHSCCNNTDILFLENRKMLLFTVLPVKKGEQLFTNYGAGLDMERKQRQDYLDKNYQFTCNCEPCQNHWPTGIVQELDPDDQNVLKMKSEFEKTGLEKASYSVYAGPVIEWSFDENTLSDVVKMILMVYENFNGYTAFVHATLCVTYIQEFYERLYGVRIFKIPSDC